MLGCNSWSYVCKMSECMMTLLVYKDICEKLLIVSGNVEMNPGPSKVCPKCEKSVANRTMVCSCGYSFRKHKQIDPKVVSENKRITHHYFRWPCYPHNLHIHDVLLTS